MPPFLYGPRPTPTWRPAPDRPNSGCDALLLGAPLVAFAHLLCTTVLLSSGEEEADGSEVRRIVMLSCCSFRRAARRAGILPGCQFCARCGPWRHIT
jgi:hypothetical protein